MAPSELQKHTSIWLQDLSVSIQKGVPLQLQYPHLLNQFCKMWCGVSAIQNALLDQFLL